MKAFPLDSALPLLPAGWHNKLVNQHFALQAPVQLGAHQDAQSLKPPKETLGGQSLCPEPRVTLCGTTGFLPSGKLPTGTIWMLKASSKTSGKNQTSKQTQGHPQVSAGAAGALRKSTFLSKTSSVASATQSFSYCMEL